MVILLFSMQGRIGRMPHVLAILGLIVVQLLFEWLLSKPAVEDATFDWRTLCHCLVFLCVAWMGWCLSIKRAHDLGKSGWWVAKWSLMPLLSILAFALFAGVALLAFGGAGETLKSDPAVNMLFIAALIAIFALNLLSFWNLVIKLIFFQGERTDNDFGPPPGPWAPLFDEAGEVLQPFNTPLNPSAPRIPAGAARAATPAAHAVRTAVPRGSGKPAAFGRRGFKPA